MSLAAARVGGLAPIVANGLDSANSLASPAWRISSGVDNFHRSHLQQASTHSRETARTLRQGKLHWDQPPENVLIVKKYKNNKIAELMFRIAIWLVEEKRLKVFVEPSVLEEETLRRCRDEVHGSLCNMLNPWYGAASDQDRAAALETPHDCMTPSRSRSNSRPIERIDFVITLGGDGTVLYVASLFQQAVPPIVAFHLGSLGFLTNFDYSRFQATITNVIESNARLNLRMRLACSIERSSSASHPIHCMNELVIDRGTSSYLAHLELHVDDHLVTIVQADGLIVATPTGSTAYSRVNWGRQLSAGGAIVHPTVPAMLFTPICPHTLSFRPLVLPDSVEVKVVNPIGSRSSAWVSFDGRNRVEVPQGAAVRIRASEWAVPTVCVTDATLDWFNSLSRCLNWNSRQPQKPLEENEESDEASATLVRHHIRGESSSASGRLDGDDGC